MFGRFDRTSDSDGQTDKQSQGYSIYGASIASRGKIKTHFAKYSRASLISLPLEQWRKSMRSRNAMPAVRTTKYINLSIVHSQPPIHEFGTV